VRILALDTTTRGGSVAVAHDADILAVIAGDVSRTHGERLPAEIDAALHQAHTPLAAIDLLVVASGPGAFTGLRIGLAAIQGLAMVIGKPVVGVSALDGLAWCAQRDASMTPDTTVATWMDAQRGEVFSAMFEPMEANRVPAAVAGPDVGLPQEALRVVHAAAKGRVLFIGDGATRHRDQIEIHSQWSVANDVPLLAPALSHIGQRLAAAGHAGPPHALRPLYVRRPDAELERQRRLE
jgi:tRNA threonylcarbamoyladenosine biosynthesis protein TsaB